MQTVAVTLVFVLFTLPALLQVWRRRATLGSRHLAAFAALLAVGGTTVAVFGPHVRSSGEPNWGQLGALFIALGGAALALLGLVGLCGALLLRALPPPSAPKSVPRTRSTPRESDAPRVSAALSEPAATAAASPAAWTAPSPRPQRRTESEPEQGPAPQPWYTLAAGVAGVWIFCTLMWLYAGVALFNGVFHVPIGRRSHYVLTGAVAAMAAIALILLTFAVFTYMLQRIDARRSARWRAWRRGSAWAAIGMLVAALLLQIARRLL